MNWRLGLERTGRPAILIAVGLALVLVLGLVVIGASLIGGGGALFGAGQGCPGGRTSGSAKQVAAVTQPTASAAGQASIPADYLHEFQQAGRTYGVPWVVLAGIGEVESNDGRSTLPGVHSGANAFGAAGPMQIGIGGAAGDAWATYATVEDGKPPASVYNPADAIAGAAKYLIARGAQSDVSAAIFAYNHANWYVAEVLSWASTYA